MAVAVAAQRGEHADHHCCAAVDHHLQEPSGKAAAVQPPALQSSPPDRSSSRRSLPQLAAARRYQPAALVVARTLEAAVSAALAWVVAPACVQTRAAGRHELGGPRRGYGLVHPQEAAATGAAARAGVQWAVPSPWQPLDEHGPASQTHGTREARTPAVAETVAAPGEGERSPQEGACTRPLGLEQPLLGRHPGDGGQADPACAQRQLLTHTHTAIVKPTLRDDVVGEKDIGCIVLSIQNVRNIAFWASPRSYRTYTARGLVGYDSMARWLQCLHAFEVSVV